MQNQLGGRVFFQRMQRPSQDEGVTLRTPWGRRGPGEEPDATLVDLRALVLPVRTLGSGTSGRATSWTSR